MFYEDARELELEDDPYTDRVNHLASIAGEVVECACGCGEHLLGQDAIWNDDLDLAYYNQEHKDKDDETMRAHAYMIEDRLLGFTRQVDRLSREYF